MWKLQHLITALHGRIKSTEDLLKANEGKDVALVRIAKEEVEQRMRLGFDELKDNFEYEKSFTKKHREQIEAKLTTQDSLIEQLKRVQEQDNIKTNTSLDETAKKLSRKVDNVI